MVIPERIPGTKRILAGTKKGSSKGSPTGAAQEPFQVLDSTFFSKSVWFSMVIVGHSCGWLLQCAAC
jgi:hypothetical protein